MQGNASSAIVISSPSSSPHSNKMFRSCNGKSQEVLKINVLLSLQISIRGNINDVSNCGSSLIKAYFIPKGAKVIELTRFQMPFWAVAEGAGPSPFEIYFSKSIIVFTFINICLPFKKKHCLAIVVSVNPFLQYCIVVPYRECLDNECVSC